MKKESILFVDYNEYFLGLVACIVEQADIQVRFATSGEDAVGILKEGGITTMVIDLDMPGMDGFELARMAQELEPGIDIMLMTGELSPQVSRLAAEAGIGKVVVKPVRASLRYIGPRACCVDQ
jgi:CheY-like chemotaxis protein